MHPKFENEEDKKYFIAWLKNLQGLACTADLAMGDHPAMGTPEECKDKARAAVRDIWYRIFDIDANKL